MSTFFDRNPKDIVLSQEKATASLRWKNSEGGMLLQQAWHCTNEYNDGSRGYTTEWRPIEVVEADAPDVEELLK